MSAIQRLELPVEACRLTGMGLSTNGSTNYRMRDDDALTYPIIGAAMRVHNRLGPGLKEAFYQRALTCELEVAGLGVQPEYQVKVELDGIEIGLLYLDHLVENQVVVEAKSVPHLLTNEEVAQVITYLSATGKEVGLLINFGRGRLDYKRIFRPRNIDLYRERIRRYVWNPPDPRFVNSLRRRPSVDSKAAQ